MKHVLTAQEAYEVMMLFLEKHYERTDSDDIGALLGALQFFEDGVTADPAMWEDWLKCVSKVKDDEEGYALT